MSVFHIDFDEMMAEAQALTNDSNREYAVNAVIFRVDAFLNDMHYKLYDPANKVTILDQLNQAEDWKNRVQHRVEDGRENSSAELEEANQAYEFAFEAAVTYRDNFAALLSSWKEWTGEDKWVPRKERKKTPVKPRASAEMQVTF